MSAEKIFDIRFTAPVGIMILFIFLFSPQSFNEFTKEFKYVEWVISAIGLLGSGLMISSFSTLLTRLLKTHLPEGDYDFDKIFNTEHISNKDSAKELSIWIGLDLENNRYENGSLIPSQIQKRWNMAMASFNAFFGVLFGIIIANVIFENYPISFYYFIAILFMFIFLINGTMSLCSTQKMNILLAKRNKILK